MTFSVLLEHSDACGVIGSRKVKVPTTAATAVILVCRGATQILIPAPSIHEQERVDEGIGLLPIERRKLVKTIDTDGALLNRVREFLGPLRLQARKWPEDAFISFSEGFLYQVLLATKHKAGILDHTVQNLREFVPIVNQSSWTGEARFRLAELLALICSYEPESLEHLAVRAELPLPMHGGCDAWRMLETAEFRALTSASGRLGCIRNPVTVIRQLRRAIKDLLGASGVKALLSLAQTAVELTGTKVPVDAALSALDQLGAKAEASAFRPPFIDIGPATLGVYRAALASAFPTAVPPPGSIMFLEHPRGGRAGVSWLNVGEEKKLTHEADDGGHRKECAIRARRAIAGPL